jgi:hypothetical protein
VPIPKLGRCVQKFSFLSLRSSVKQIITKGDVNEGILDGKFSASSLTGDIEGQGCKAESTVCEKDPRVSWEWWLTPIILATREANIRRILV